MKPSIVVRNVDISPLADRIAAILSDDAPPSSAVDDLLTQVRREIGAVSQSLQAATGKSVDPRLDGIAALAAREEAKRLQFELDRHAAAERALLTALEAAQKREAETRRLESLARVTAQRDALAKELAEEYPRLSKALVDLLTRVEQCDAEAAQVGIEPAECVARGMTTLFRGPYGTPLPRLTASVALPSFRCADQHRLMQWDGRARLVSKDRAAA